MKRWIWGLVAAVAVLQPALADRAPTPEGRTRIEATLRAEGFQKWEEIELDDGKWEIDEVVAADGRKYEIEIDPNTYAVVTRKLN